VTQKKKQINPKIHHSIVSKRTTRSYCYRHLCAHHR